jgi:alpha-galactosidase
MRPTIHYTAGRTRYVETFEHGRLLGQRWSCDGCVPEPAAPDTMRDLPADSFDLIVDGQTLRRGWEWLDAEERDAGHHVLRLRHAGRSIGVSVHTETDASGFLQRRIEIANEGASPVSITRVSSFAGLLFPELEAPDLAAAESPFEIGRFLYRAWHTEGRFAWEPLPFDTLCLDAVRATSGWGPPFCMIRHKATGETFVIGLAWSANWRMEFNYDPFYCISSLSCRIGPSAAPPLRVLEPGARTASPPVHIGLQRGNEDDIVQAWHDYLRRRVMPKNRMSSFPPLSYNHSGGVLKDRFEGEQLLAEIDKAAEIGAELFVVDAGWFGRTRNRYSANCGDWIPGPCLPDGMAPVADRIHGHGMQFGLWVAFWMVGNKSAVFEAHPEWLIEIEGHRYFPNITEEGHPGFYMNLDLANPEALAWIEAELERIVTSYNVDMLRLDGGPTNYDGGYRDVHGYRENTLWRQNENFYRLIDRLRARHPNLLVDNCCSGGGRLDYAMLARSDIAWISDDHRDPQSMIRTLNGTTLALPPEICTRTFGTILRNRDDMAWALRVPLFGQYCVSGLEDGWRDPASTEYALIRRHLAVYKEFLRPFMRTCQVFHHTPVLVGADRSPWCVIEYAAADGDRAAIGVFRLDDEADRSCRIHPRGLTADRIYRVTLDNDQRSWTAGGRELMQKGLAVDLPERTDSELILLAEDETER